MHFPPHLSWLLLPEPTTAADSDGDCTWAYGWPAGVRLSAELAVIAELRGATVADLGCGRGHGGFSALALGAGRVVFADGNLQAVDWIQAVIAANRLGGRATAHLHQWGATIPGGPFALIIGGDILYRPDCFAALIASLAASLADDGVAVLSDPRAVLEAELAPLAAAAGLTWESERRPGGYTLVRARRARALPGAGSREP